MLTNPVRGTLTIRQLRDFLNTLPEEVLEYPVFSEGCDCIGESDGIDVNHIDHYALVKRMAGR